MRDLLLTAIFIGLIPMILSRPYVGALAWAWVSLMSPHRLTYGFAYSFPIGTVVAGTTLVALLFTSERKPFPWNSITVLLILFVSWMSLTTIWALNPNSDGVMNAWIQALKIHLMLLVTLVLIRGRQHIEALIWVMVLSIGYYGTKGGFFTLRTAGAHRVWGPTGTFIEGNNELALALVAVIPLMYYLVVVSRHLWVRRGLWFAIALCIASILGSHSRGALVAVLGMLLFFVAKSNRPFMISAVLATVLGIALLAMPAEWFARMDTITDYQEDSSAMSRINTWTTIWNMAMDRPIVGAGFCVGSDLLYQLYSPNPLGKSFDSHSIYFQALGEHGFVGLTIYLLLGISVWRRASKLAKACEDGPDKDWVPTLMRMTQVSLIGFATGGAFLGLLHYDFPYYLAGIVVMVDATCKDNSGHAFGVASGQAASQLSSR
ncbi:MAG: putative O-glycosylation ligase, exosortase A system-associated [Candidatus Accumulibacter sp.]|uniref:putative O-glycosylation ligase, exosortase A system-associated n=1 Tax=Accumulibacter sp. TaxID=2053492 RepID=UPI0025829B4C|nr:putative O-glycosylation ligase, exosortase A system-associated [Accumulibacter sp.]MCM8620678.1 putative O-glycosylation ligase, exosortase A system-associated [Accumulibacter sp.]